MANLNRSEEDEQIKYLLNNTVVYVIYDHNRARYCENLPYVSKKDADSLLFVLSSRKENSLTFKIHV